MFDEGQVTLAHEVVVGGVGIHSGRRSVVTLRPAGADLGIALERRGRLFRIEPGMVSRIPLCTRLSTPLGHVDTVEHLMAALAITGVDNVVIEIDGDEVPVLDGSALPWAEAIRCAGLRRLRQSRKRYIIRKPFRFEIGSSLYDASPLGDRISVTVDFKDTIIGVQSTSVSWSEASSLLDARTFVLEKDIEEIRARGFAKGGSMNNAVVVGSSGVLNPEGLRGPDEIARHKALDLIGDLFVAGKRIVGSIRAVRPGHSGNSAFLMAMIGEGVLAETPAKESAPIRMPWGIGASSGSAAEPASAVA